MLELSNVTLVAIFGVAHELSMMAVEECCKRVRFGDIQLFTNDPFFALEWVPSEPLPIAYPGSITKAGPFKDFTEAARFTTYEVPKHIRTSHALFIHWDSWVVNPDMWTDDFLQCDYIGAPWWYRDGYNVGNSGFCLRSKRLIDFLAAHENEFPIRMPEDNTLCRDYRRRLHQFRWANELMAHKFAFERVRIVPRSFGFHGVFNWHLVMSEDELKQKAEVVERSEYARSRPEYSEFLASCRKVLLMENQRA